MSRALVASLEAEGYAGVSGGRIRGVRPKRSWNGVNFVDLLIEFAARLNESLREAEVNEFFEFGAYCSRYGVFTGSEGFVLIFEWDASQNVGG